MNPEIAKLLEPVSADQPCGPDLSYDPGFDELERLLKGTPEVEIGSYKKPAEPPDWPQLKDRCVDFLRRSKHLRAGVIFCCALLKNDGLAGFRDGLQYLEGLLSRFWPGLYPLLDPEDNLDPTQRLNLLGALTAPRGSVDSWLRIQDYLYTVPLGRPPGLPDLNLDQILAAHATDGAPAGPASAGPDAAQIAAAMHAADPRQIASDFEAIEAALTAVAGIDSALTNLLGARQTISFDVLENTLRALSSGLKPYLPHAQDPSAAGANQPHGLGTSNVAPQGPGVTITGSIRSRDDVVAALDSLCEYYRQAEPGSPVPLLLRRAQRMAKMGFVELMQELNVATAEQLRPSLGSGLDAPPTS